jgi:hypothetical protein
MSPDSGSHATSVGEASSRGFVPSPRLVLGTGERAAIEPLPGEIINCVVVRVLRVGADGKFVLGDRPSPKEASERVSELHESRQYPTASVLMAWDAQCSEFT